MARCCDRANCDHCDHCKKIGAKRLALLQSEGLELVVWHEARDGMLTFYSDPRIAADLGWFPRNRADGEPSRADQIRGTGDGNRVRSLRRHIDRCRCFFDGYTFGTKTNGAGRHVSRLHKRGTDTGGDALNLQVGEVLARSQQAFDQHGAERERIIAAFIEVKDTFIRLGDMDKAFCADHCLRDVEQFNYVMPATADEARRLGIPIPRRAS